MAAAAVLPLTHVGEVCWQTVDDSLVAEAAERLPESSRRHIRWMLVGFWMLSLLALIGSAVLLTFIDGTWHAPARAYHQWTDYALPGSLSFMSEYVDASLGMDYGTTLIALRPRQSASCRSTGSDACWPRPT